MARQSTLTKSSWRVVVRASFDRPPYGPDHMSKEEALREACRRLAAGDDNVPEGIEGPDGERITSEEIARFCFS